MSCVKIQRAQGKNFLFDKRQEQIPEKKPSEETEKEAKLSQSSSGLSMLGVAWSL